ncbi:MAG: hypothetical protein A3B74_03320 [Candidatus Kerfeldbacteria bacterium RIFCSPHIGHO2_02_FULL_42_14]|uniref:Membrane insertase YidC/Oxa/ALB C-terminal domain-containing protein n=1 Tax=Candidatus Kerfeldbacteria bacterium RIFCSPHIGHO2_02_FULL_42_14 TaxID=1798540 RepID=A0A1G2APG7_9BACT|nr:MAG: hypothetical protein A3B74_03320 [Candidatus Kerfeldbacteria bacterium RIFCSPHIGHO2_02_FULL_42_14]OGY80938.1 MAG: hypothetical protein A3E60_03230 [Candidatus Kerfeldbacteria bacterium RIFCSPHIGHO2_12_FULL_42_13]OGY84172.1 MAG: hypothetical protein A3I91_01635 [Candidatus Kerfeldbacteria bacterium RIFCSPLOWO2_02_FULL_42_19]OGY87303.1 MAG: hypothetical protein A3G01_03110 [Candidatus Kerfeldbacteria bacterium RIFCSPLOWO2_12_FULL_43_9]
MIELFNTILYEPLFNALIYFYRTFGDDMGIAIVVLTLIIKIVLFVPSFSSLKAQRALQETQPKIEALKQKYQHDKELLGRKLIEFYKENKVNPLSSCLPLLIQLPILIALYRVFFGGLETNAETGTLISNQLEHLYTPLQAIYAVTPIKTATLGGIDLAIKGNYILAILAGVGQFVSSKLMSTKKVKPAKVPASSDENMTAALNKQMLYFLPVLTIVFGVQFPAGVTLYWLVSTLFTLLQQIYFFKIFQKKLPQQQTPPPNPT